MIERTTTPTCRYCGEQHATDVICQRMFAAHAAPFSRSYTSDGKAYWLIERGSPAEWWAGTDRGDAHCWTRDVCNVHPLLKFQTAEAAQGEADRIKHWPMVIGSELRVTEHIDCGGPDMEHSFTAARGWTGRHAANLTPVTEHRSANEQTNAVPQGSAGTHRTDPAGPVADDAHAPAGAAPSETARTKFIRCVWVVEREFGYGKAMRVVDSDHPRFTTGSRFDYGFLNIAVTEGYRVQIDPVPPHVKHDIEEPL